MPRKSGEAVDANNNNNKQKKKKKARRLFSDEAEVAVAKREKRIQKAVDKGAQQAEARREKLLAQLIETNASSSVDEERSSGRHSSRRNGPIHSNNAASASTTAGHSVAQHESAHNGAEPEHQTKAKKKKARRLFSDEAEVAVVKREKRIQRAVEKEEQKQIRKMTDDVAGRDGPKEEDGDEGKKRRKSRRTFGSEVDKAAEKRNRRIQNAVEKEVQKRAAKVMEKEEREIQRAAAAAASETNEAKVMNGANNEDSRPSFDERHRVGATATAAPATSNLIEPFPPLDERRRISSSRRGLKKSGGVLALLNRLKLRTIVEDLSREEVT